MSENIKPYEIVFPCEEDEALLCMATTIINQYAEQGIMLAVTVERLQQIAAHGLLALAVSSEGETIGSAGIMFEYPDGKKEFGGWAVKPEWTHTGVGKQLLQTLLQQHKDDHIIAFGNDNSGPIFLKLGASILDQQQMHPDAFVPCKVCQCKGKEHLSDGQLCVDRIFDLNPILTTE